MINGPKRNDHTPPSPSASEETTQNREAAAAPATEPAPLPAKRIDGRSARRSNRTVQFATRVTPQFDDRIRAIAQRDGLLLVEVLELALEAYEETKNRR